VAETHFKGGQFSGKECEVDSCSLAVGTGVFTFHPAQKKWVKGSIVNEGIREGKRKFLTRYYAGATKKFIWSRFRDIVRNVKTDRTMLRAGLRVIAPVGDKGRLVECTISGFASKGKKRVLLRVKHNGAAVRAAFHETLIAPMGGQCEDCSRNHYGPRCQRCAGSGCLHGRCDDGIGGTGKCVCFRGWTGDNCDKCDAGFYQRPGSKSCSPCPAYKAPKVKGERPGVCSGHGVCAEGMGASGKYHCALGWGGYHCGRCAPGYFGTTCRKCPGTFRGTKFIPCGGNGSCDDGIKGSGTCKCHTSWTKDKAGNCTVCKKGFYGPYCAKCPTSGGKICAGVGSCNDGRKGDGRCQCDPQFRGFSCSQCQRNYFGSTCKACPGGNCSGHGACADGRKGSGQCTCQEGWTGAACDDCVKTGPKQYFGDSCARCPGKGNCNGHGQCNAGRKGDGSCKCSRGWAGASCDHCAQGYFSTECKPCPGLSKVSGACSGNGSCDSGFRGKGTCSCTMGWAGDACDKCADGFFGSNCAPCSCEPGDKCDAGLKGTGKCTPAKGSQPAASTPKPTEKAATVKKASPKKTTLLKHEDDAADSSRRAARMARRAALANQLSDTPAAVDQALVQERAGKADAFNMPVHKLPSSEAENPVKESATDGGDGAAEAAAQAVAKESTAANAHRDSSVHLAAASTHDAEADKAGVSNKHTGGDAAALAGALNPEAAKESLIETTDRIHVDKALLKKEKAEELAAEKRIAAIEKAGKTPPVTVAAASSVEMTPANSRNGDPIPADNSDSASVADTDPDALAAHDAKDSKVGDKAAEPAAAAAPVAAAAAAAVKSPVVAAKAPEEVKPAAVHAATSTTTAAAKPATVVADAKPAAAEVTKTTTLVKHSESGNASDVAVEKVEKQPSVASVHKISVDENGGDFAHHVPEALKQKAVTEADAKRAKEELELASKMEELSNPMLESQEAVVVRE
jgi:hypothetical protein